MKTKNKFPCKTAYGIFEIDDKHGHDYILDDMISNKRYAQKVVKRMRAAKHTYSKIAIYKMELIEVRDISN